MAIARPWRAPRPDGPYAAVPEDHASLNHVFSEAFTERYRRDGQFLPWQPEQLGRL